MTSTTRTARNVSRGAGYTQASRHLAEHVNQPRQPYEFDEVRLFADRDQSNVRALVDGAAARGIDLPWRNLDCGVPPREVSEDPELLACYERGSSPPAPAAGAAGAPRAGGESLIAGMIVDLVLANSAAATSVPELRPWSEKLAIGTCPLAEKYFLELAQGFVRRTGRMNILVSEEGRPRLVEKLNLGDDHSCISLTPLLLNGVRLPRGSLLGVTYRGDVAMRPNARLAGQVIPLGRCDGFRFLRLWPCRPPAGAALFRRISRRRFSADCSSPVPRRSSRSSA